MGNGAYIPRSQSTFVSYIFTSVTQQDKEDIGMSLPAHFGD
jgi:hypothetical protein